MMPDRSTLDMYALRGMAGILRILEEREGSVSLHVQNYITWLKDRLTSVAASEGTDQASLDLHRLDKWLVTGATTFVEFLADRASQGRLESNFDLPIRAMIEKLERLRKQIKPEGP